MNVITLDFETYYDTEHSLAHLSAVQYVHSPLFKVWGVGIKILMNSCEEMSKSKMGAIIVLRKNNSLDITKIIFQC